jgi:hypothetical protein
MVISEIAKYWLLAVEVVAQLGTSEAGIVVHGSGRSR